MNQYYLEKDDYNLKIDLVNGKFIWWVRFRQNPYPRERGSGVTLFDAWQKGIKALDNAVKSVKVEVGA